MRVEGGDGERGCRKKADVRRFPCPPPLPQKLVLASYFELKPLATITACSFQEVNALTLKNRSVKIQCSPRAKRRKPYPLPPLLTCTHPSSPSPLQLQLASGCLSCANRCRKHLSRTEIGGHCLQFICTIMIGTLTHALFFSHVSAHIRRHLHE